MQSLDRSIIDKLIRTAIEQLKFSYAPYSGFNKCSKNSLTYR